MPLGLSEALPEGKRLTGNSGSAGPSVTAGGLVFVGATSDRRLRAFDAKTGKELWSARLPGQVNANPMIYRGEERQADGGRGRDRYAGGLRAAMTNQAAYAGSTTGGVCMRARRIVVPLAVTAVVFSGVLRDGPGWRARHSVSVTVPDGFGQGLQIRDDRRGRVLRDVHRFAGDREQQHGRSSATAR